MDDCHVFTLTSADGTKLCARHWEAKSPAATLVVVHGLGEHSGRYSDFGLSLSARGIDVFAVDLRGHGRSAGKRGVIASYDDFRADLRALLDHVAGARRTDTATLFGHSMGGGVVLDFGLAGDPAQHGIARVIASAPLVEPTDPIPAPLELVARTVARIAPNAAMKNVITGAQISTLPDEQARYEQDPDNHARLGFRLALEMIGRGRDMAQEAANWPAGLPLLIVHSSGDQLTDFAASERFAAQAGARFMRFDGTEHELHNDTARAAIYDAVEAFAKAG